MIKIKTKDDMTPAKHSWIISHPLNLLPWNKKSRMPAKQVKSTLAVN